MENKDLNNNLININSLHKYKLNKNDWDSQEDSVKDNNIGER